MFGVFVDSAALIFLNQLAWFGVATVKRDNTFADVGWGTGIMLVAFNAMRAHPTAMTKSLFFMALVWGLRLSSYLLFRHVSRGNGREDWRYTALRARWKGAPTLNSFLFVFMAQGFFQYVITLLFQWASVGRVSVSPMFMTIGATMFTIGVLYEAVADAQLYMWKSNPDNKGRTFTGGLWGLSRHPNYFGEILAWWGMFAATLPTPTALFTFLAPVTVTGLLLKVSGVTILERKLAKRRDYKDYIADRPAVMPSMGGATESMKAASAQGMEAVSRKIPAGTTIMGRRVDADGIKELTKMLQEMGDQLPDRIHELGETLPAKVQELSETFPDQARALLADLPAKIETLKADGPQAVQQVVERISTAASAVASKAGAAKDAAMTQAAAAKDAAAAKAGAAKESITKKASEAADSAKGAAKSAKKSVDQTAEDVKETAQDASKVAKDAADDAADKVSATAESAKQTVEQATQDAEDGAKNAADSASKKMQSAKKDLSDATDRATDEVAKATASAASLEVDGSKVETGVSFADAAASPDSSVVDAGRANASIDTAMRTRTAAATQA